jgi:hypothetical protein
MILNFKRVAACLLVFAVLCVLAGIFLFQPKKENVGRQGNSRHLGIADSTFDQSTVTFPGSDLVSKGDQMSRQTHSEFPPSDRPARAERLQAPIGVAPDHLQSFLQAGGNRIPTFEELAALTPEDQPWLLEAYKQKQFSEKLALTWALATVGDETVVNVFTNALFHEYSRVLNGQLEGVSYADAHVMLQETIRALATLSYHHDSAFEYIKAGMDPAFWIGIGLEQAHPKSGSVGPLSSLCIAGLGVSGRQEAWQMIEEFKRTDINKLNVHPFNVVSAAFNFDMVTIHGIDYLKSYWPHHMSHEGLEIYRQWKETERGGAWAEWGRIKEAQLLEIERKRIEELRNAGKLP